MGNDLLLEVGVEEVPSHYLPQLLGQMRELSSRLFHENRLPYEQIRCMATPRRLVLHVQGLSPRQTEIVQEVQGPPKVAGFDAQGRLTQAALAFAKAHGVSPASLQVKTVPKGEYLFAVVKEKGRGSPSLLKELLPQFLASLSFPKSMQWNESKIRFVRPVRWILALNGDRIVSFRFADVRSGGRSYGHTLMRPGGFVVKKPATYLKDLDKRFVVVDQDRRRAMILKQVTSLAKTRKGRLETDETL